MSTTQLQIYNRALRALGVASLDATTDNVEQAEILNDIYDGILDEVMVEHPWNFAIKRAELTELGGAITSWTDNGSNVWYATLTTAPGEVTFDGIEGTEQSSYAACTADYYWYYDSDNDLLYVYSTSDPDDAFGTVFARIAEFEWTYAFSLPTDSLRVIKMEDNADYIIEGSRLFTNESECKIQYIADISDTTTFPPYFTSLLVTRLAAETAFPLTHSTKTMEDMFELYIRKLRIAKGVDAQEGVGQSEDESSWEDSRE
jgi:hypothetical protein